MASKVRVSLLRIFNEMEKKTKGGTLSFLKSSTRAINNVSLITCACQHRATLRYCQSLCNCKFLLSTLRKSAQNRKLSNMGRRLRRAVSLGSENQLFIGMALSG